ncbi:MAG: hypothetical protein EZS28_052609 [Streblomastix strix]|uniref:Uncharacterized protein n=1 Tax=Streblomastix strix TaxID=222440 RepID=A0A5J4S023_9EUKA|nr:MAG: hypothetical protein EZS28_052609 [Streblomastix strix]
MMVVEIQDAIRAGHPYEPCTFTKWNKEDADEYSQSERKILQNEQLLFEDDDSEIIENPAKTPKPAPQKTIKKPQINYILPQVDLEEFNTFAN